MLISIASPGIVEATGELLVLADGGARDVGEEAGLPEVEAGRIRSITSRLPGFWSPMELSIPHGVSYTRWGGFPSRGSRVVPLRQTAPASRLLKPSTRVYSSPNPTHPERRTLGEARVRPHSSTAEARARFRELSRGGGGGRHDEPRGGTGARSTVDDYSRAAPSRTRSGRTGADRIIDAVLPSRHARSLRPAPGLRDRVRGARRRRTGTRRRPDANCESPERSGPAFDV